MKITYFSDIHEEFGPLDIDLVKSGEVLIVAGDLSPLSTGKVSGTLNKLSAKFEHVVYVAGNHEFYHGFIEDKPQELNENVHFLQNACKYIKGVKFIGCTMWTDFGKEDPSIIYRAQRNMNDYRMICQGSSLDNILWENATSTITPTLILAKHKESIKYLEQEIAPGCVVVTHHAPHPKSTNPRHRDSSMNALYHSDLTYLMGMPALWIHGHTHDTHSYSINGTKVRCNPRGYVNYEENPKFNLNKTIKIS